MVAALRLSRFAIPFMALCAGVHPVAASEGNLVVNGDFEQPGRIGSPPGRTMWGARRDKVLDHVTCDTPRPHGGQARFRIRHPAGTAGYLVSAPEDAIRSREDMRYVENDLVHDLPVTLTGDRLATTLLARSVAFLTLTREPPPRQGGKTGDASIEEAARWLHAKAVAMIRASRVTMASGVAAFPPQAGAGYSAFWLRDFAYQLEGCRDAFSDRELTDACRVFVRAMGSDGSGVDCVKFDGTPVYKPGFGTMGEHPVADGSPFTVAVAWHAYQKTRDPQLLAEVVDPLVKALRAVPRDPRTGLVFIRPGGWDRCPYGFTDTVRKQGAELFTSLLHIQACRRLADLLDAAHRPAEAGRWRGEAERLIPILRTTFWDARVGLFRAATVSCTQPDIWGSAFAVDLEVATPEQSRTVATYFKNHYDEIVQRGQIRHLPGGVYWDAACPRDTYQNGGYWATATGWFVETLDLVDPGLADRTVINLVDDFRTRGVSEWVLGPRTAVMNYLASATMPLAGVRTLCARRGTHPPGTRGVSNVELKP